MATTTLTVQQHVYSVDALLRACYWFTDRAFLFLEEESSDAIRVHITAKTGQDLEAVTGEFMNRLLDEELRVRLHAETMPIRDLIIAQAFADTTLDETSADYHDDPVRILS